MAFEFAAANTAGSAAAPTIASEEPFGLTAKLRSIVVGAAFAALSDWEGDAVAAAEVVGTAGDDGPPFRKMVLRAGALEVTSVADAAVESENTLEDDDEKDLRVDDDAVVAGALAVRVITSVLTTVAVEVVTETDSETVADVGLVAETPAKIEDSNADWVDRGSSGESDDEKAAEEGDADCESVDAEKVAAVEDAIDIDDDVVAVLEAALAELELAETKVDATLEADE